MIDIAFIKYISMNCFEKIIWLIVKDRDLLSGSLNSISVSVMISFDLLVFFLPFGSLQEWLPAKNLLYEAFTESFDLLLHLLKFCLAVEVFNDSDLRGDGKESM